jgi:hypothetical protein
MHAKDDIWSDEDEDADSNAVDDALHIEDSVPSTAQTFLTIVDISGIHQLPVDFCRCSGNNTTDDIQLLDMGLFPASFVRIKTAFTFRLLADYRLESIECKTSAYHYFMKIRRITSPAFPQRVPVSHIYW